MGGILPLTLLGVIVVVVAAMPWRRLDPNHLFFLELLKTHLQDGPDLNADPPYPSLKPFPRLADTTPQSLDDHRFTQFRRPN